MIGCKRDLTRLTLGIPVIAERQEARCEVGQHSYSVKEALWDRHFGFSSWLTTEAASERMSFSSASLSVASFLSKLASVKRM